MTCFDFDAAFTGYLRAWLEENQDRYDHIEQIEQLMPELYERFIDSPIDDLMGRSPRQYFEGVTDVPRLLEMMKGYLNSNVPLPDLLPMHIASFGLLAEAPLCEMLLDSGAPMEARMLCVGMLQDIGSNRLMETYIAWQKNREEEDELADFTLESLEEMGETAVPFMLEALQDANDAGREALLSVLSRYPGTPGVFEHLIRLFDARPGHQAALAAYLGRLGDERALPVLMERALEDQVRYLDYIELRSAIEALGGEAPEREFASDPDYDALRGTN